MNIELELSGARSVAITGHIRPDGDCVGSVMGLYNYIKNNMPGIEADVYLEKPGEEFNYIKNIDKVKNIPDMSKKYDVFVVLDCSSIDRIEPFMFCFKNAGKTICIDHHRTNDSFAQVNEIQPEASSTCEVLFETMDEKKIDKSIAECLYTGIIHDTGVFKYSATSGKTMNIAGKLMDKGIDYSDIIDNSFYKKTYVQNQVLGRALLESILFYDKKCIFSVITKKDMDFYGVDGKQLGGIIEQLRLTDGVEVAIFLYETGKDEYKVSLRSKKYIDVSLIAAHYKGGGHIRAAGCTMHGTVHEIINNIGEMLEKQFSQYETN